jgi:hypothetical protein
MIGHLVGWKALGTSGLRGDAQPLNRLQGNQQSIQVSRPQSPRATETESTGLTGRVCVVLQISWA